MSGTELEIAVRMAAAMLGSFRRASYQIAAIYRFPSLEHLDIQEMVSWAADCIFTIGVLMVILQLWIVGFCNC